MLCWGRMPKQTISTPGGYGSTPIARSIQRACISRAGRVRDGHELDRDGRCIFCDWLLPEGFGLCPCGCGLVVELPV